MSSILDRKLREVFLEAIQKLTISDTHLPLYHWNNVSRRRLRYAIEESIVTQEDITETLVKKLKVTGRSYFERIKVSGEFPDNTFGFPEVLAFALEHDEFAEEEKMLLKFDHGDTLVTFTQLYYRTDFIEKMFQQLITEVPSLPSHPLHTLFLSQVC